MNIETKQRNYGISFIDTANYIKLGEEILYNFNTKNFIILTEKNIPHEYYNEIIQYFKIHSAKIHLINLESTGEGNKDFKIVETILENIFRSVTLNKNSVLIAIGGGVIGDLGGFIASILMRGINLVQIPTTLLAMADSSIGGKTGINGFGCKNIIGTFYQPNMVICNIDFLKTLSYKEYISGYAEIIKHSIITSEYRSFLQDLLRNENKILNRDSYFIKEILQISCKIKANIVNIDENETLGIRSFLNFGHTIAHAIEKLTQLDGKILHGNAVAIGIICELLFANKLGYFEDIDIINTLINHFQNLKLPVKLSEIIDINQGIYLQICNKVTMDKKNHQELNEDVMISFAIPTSLGNMKNIRIKLSKFKNILPHILL